MSEEETREITRRDVLQKSAAAGIAGLGATSAVSARGDFDTEVEQVEKDLSVSMLKEEGVVLTPDEVAQTNADVELPSADVREGQRLLSRLASDGLLRKDSLRAFPSYQRGNDAEGSLYRIRKNGRSQISFTTQTPEGRLQVIFSEKSIPSAALFPEDGGPVVLYTAADGSTYDRFESDLTVGPSDGDVTTNACSDYSCDGCSCDDDWCFWSTDALKCLTCEDGDCIVTDDCGC